MDLSLMSKAAGPNLTLRLIQPEDAAYVHGLRTHPAYSGHLSQVTGSVEDQRQWIEACKTQEAAGRSLYYVIERKDSTRCGLVRLYDIRPERFTWGSWILDGNKPPKAALESSLLSFGIGFGVLCRDLKHLSAILHSIQKKMALIKRFPKMDDTKYILKAFV